MARPWPVPRPTGLVVKNGSKMRSQMASGMPAPVSSTAITTRSPRSRVCTRSRPFRSVPRTTSSMA